VSPYLDRALNDPPMRALEQVTLVADHGACAVRVLITGSRDWIETDPIWSALGMLQVRTWPLTLTVVHGACPTGVDAIAADCCRNWAVFAEIHPADWQRHGKAAGPIRNSEMVARGASVCLAFIRNASRGATDCADRAERAGIPTIRWTA